MFQKLKENKIPGIFIRLLIFIYLQQSCRVRWGETLSEKFSVKNGVRQGAVLSPTLFSLYINSLLIQLKSSGFGCHIGNHFYGALAYADDIALLCPSRAGLDSMFKICERYFDLHKIIISTNPDIKKTKTKCLYFSHNQDKNIPAPIFHNESPLPWVNAWQHLGNQLNTADLSKPFQSNMNSDSSDKRRKFVGKVHSLLQEFGFLNHSSVFDLINIYATSFYGSNLWLLSGASIDRLFTSWNTMVRLVWNLPNTTHRYFVEEISHKPHMKASLYYRYLNFVKSLRSSKKKCVSSLCQRLCDDQGSIIRKNLNIIEKESNCANILSLDSRFVSNHVIYAPVPDEEIWRINFIEELIQIRSNELFVDGFSRKEIQELINLIATS